MNRDNHDNQVLKGLYVATKRGRRLQTVRGYLTTYGEEKRRSGWKNSYIDRPEREGTYLVEDHDGNIFKSDFKINQFGTPVWTKNKGYDICWWKEIENE